MGIRIEGIGEMVFKGCFCLVAKSCLDSLRLWDFLSKNIGVGCHFLLQGIFQTQGYNSHLVHWQAESLSLSHHRKPV